ncbi:MAG: type II secretion system protein [Acidobacteriota bacterium]
MTARRNRAGFSLSEVLVVIALGSLVLTATAPTVMRALKKTRLQAASTTVMVQLRTAATAARATGQEHRVVFDDGRVSVLNAETGAYERGHRNINIDPHVRVETEDHGGGVITFFRNGTAASGDIEVYGGFPVLGDDDAEAKVTISILRSGLIRTLETF